MNIYTHFYKKGKHLYLRGYKDKARFEDKILISPYLFRTARKDSQSPYRTIRGNHVERVDFDDIYAAKSWMKDNRDIHGLEIAGSENFLYNEIYQQYPGQIEYNLSDISVVFLDIENDIPKEGGFPNPVYAPEEITAITMYKNGVYYHLATHQVDTNDEQLEGLKVEFLWFLNEEELIRGFLRIWYELDPDIVTGWNVANYDMSYLYNRIKKVLGKSKADSLSPWKEVEERTYEKFNRTQTEYDFKGLVVLDYLDLYKKFSFKSQESYTLDFISKEEIGLGKLDYHQWGKNLYEFYRGETENLVPDDENKTGIKHLTYLRTKIKGKISGK